jgi:hypothetical protein
MIGKENAPTIGSLVMNSTAPITGTGDKVFHLTSAGTQAGEPAVTIQPIVFDPPKP